MTKFWALALLLISTQAFAAQAYVSGYQGLFNPAYTATIASSGTESTAINTGGMALTGCFFPSSFTGTSVTFEAATSLAGTYVAVKSTTSGSTLTYTVAQATFAAFDPKDFQGIQFLKIKSGSTESAARTLTCTLKGF